MRGPVRKSNQRAVLDAADEIEPRLAGAVRRSVEKMREGVSTNELAMALAAKDVKRALALVVGPPRPRHPMGAALLPDRIADALSPAATIARDAVMKGGRLGAEQVRKALEG